MRPREALAAATDALVAVGVPEARLDAELLLAARERAGEGEPDRRPRRELPPAVGRLFGELVRRRLRREPLAYIVGAKGFRRIELAVDRRVLVPRPETELLVEVALERRPGRVLDIGTGSGAIALAVADELPEAEVVATDTSPGALEVARANAERLGLAGRVRFEAGTVRAGESFDLVLANLPYVAESDWAGLEPRGDRVGAARGAARRRRTGSTPTASCWRRWTRARRSACGRPSATRRTRSTAAGAIAVEIGEGQAVEVAELMRDAGFAEVEVREDLAGIERVVVGVR